MACRQSTTTVRNHPKQTESSLHGAVQGYPSRKSPWCEKDYMPAV